MGLHITSRSTAVTALVVFVLLAASGCGESSSTSATSTPSTTAVESTVTTDFPRPNDPYEPVECSARHAADGTLADLGLAVTAVEPEQRSETSSAWPGGQGFVGTLSVTNEGDATVLVNDKHPALLLSGDRVVAVYVPGDVEGDDPIAQMEPGGAGVVHILGTSFASGQAQKTILEDGVYQLVVRITATVTGADGMERRVTVDSPTVDVEIPEMSVVAD
jgi:hypothetical protein